jgi:hypothetical protein
VPMAYSLRFMALVTSILGRPQMVWTSCRWVTRQLFNVMFFSQSLDKSHRLVLSTPSTCASATSVPSRRVEIAQRWYFLLVIDDSVQIS